MNRLLNHTASNFIMITIIGFVVILSIATYRRNPVFNDEESLWNDVVEKAPKKSKGHYNLALAYSAKTQTDQAIEHFEIAVKLDPNFIEAHNNLGAAYYLKGFHDKAIEHFQIALGLCPDFIMAHNNIAIAYSEKGLHNKGEEHFRIARQLKLHSSKTK